MNKDIYDAINIVCGEVANKIAANYDIAIKNFGTLSPYVLKEHDAFDVTLKKVKKSKRVKSVRFHPHVEFKRLLKERRGKFGCTQ